MVPAMERVFTHAEATALLPRLTELLIALRTAHRAALAVGGRAGTPSALIERLRVGGDEGFGAVPRRAAL